MVAILTDVHDLSIVVDEESVVLVELASIASRGLFEFLSYG